MNESGSAPGDPWRTLAQSLAGAAPGDEPCSPAVQLASTVEQVAPGVAPGDLCTDELLDAIQASARWVAWGQARQLSLISELAHRRAGAAVGELTGAGAVDSTAALSIGVRAVGEELACELTLSRRSADDRAATAVGLCLDAPETLDALQAGQIDLPRAEAILDLVQTLIGAEGEDQDGTQLARDLQDQLLERAPHQRVADLKRTGRRALISIDPDAAARRHARKRRTRHVALLPDNDSMCRLSAYLPADQGVRANTAITTLARAAWTPTDTRTLDQRRADTLVDTLIEALDNLHTPTPPENVATADDTTSPDDANPPGMSSRGMSSADISSVGVGTDGVGTDGVGTDGVGPAGLGSASAGSDGVGSADLGTVDSDDNVGVGCDPQPPGTQLPCPAPTPSKTPAPPTSAVTTPAVTTRPPKTRPPKTLIATRRPDAQIMVTISAATLTGASDEPGELHGYGPVIADMARDIAATGTWRCAILDTTHATLLGLGTSTYTPAYRPSQALRRHLSVRDRVCRAPGCNAPATRCDVDHLRPYPEGVTCECNTESLCGFHHRIKHETGFRVRWSTNPNHPPGTLIWTGPSGREYIDHPACLDPNMVNRTLPNTNPSITNTTDQTTRPGPGPERQSSNRRPNPPPLPKRDYGPPPF